MHCVSAAGNSKDRGTGLTEHFHRTRIVNVLYTVENQHRNAQALGLIDQFHAVSWANTRFVVLCHRLTCHVGVTGHLTDVNSFFLGGTGMRRDDAHQHQRAQRSGCNGYHVGCTIVHG